MLEILSGGPLFAGKIIFKKHSPSKAVLPFMKTTEFKPVRHFFTRRLCTC